MLSAATAQREKEPGILKGDEAEIQQRCFLSFSGFRQRHVWVAGFRCRWSKH